MVVEAEVYGCKVSCKLTHPDFFVVIDEVGGNINLKGDGHIGGEKSIFEAGVIPKQKESRNDKHFALCSIELLNGVQRMCVIIFTGKRANNLIELEVDPMAEEIGDISDADCMLKIKEQGKYSPADQSAITEEKRFHVFALGLPKVL